MMTSISIIISSISIIISSSSELSIKVLQSVVSSAATVMLVLQELLNDVYTS